MNGKTILHVRPLNLSISIISIRIYFFMGLLAEFTKLNSPGNRPTFTINPQNKRSLPSPLPIQVCLCHRPSPAQRMCSCTKATPATTSLLTAKHRRPTPADPWWDSTCGTWPCTEARGPTARDHKMADRSRSVFVPFSPVQVGLTHNFGQLCLCDQRHYDGYQTHSGTCHS